MIVLNPCAKYPFTLSRSLANVFCVLRTDFQTAPAVDTMIDHNARLLVFDTDRFLPRSFVRIYNNDGILHL